MKTLFFGIVAVFLFSACSWGDRNLDAGPDPDGDGGGAGDEGADQGADEGGGDDGGGGDTGPRVLRKAVVLGEGGF